MKNEQLSVNRVRIELGNLYKKKVPRVVRELWMRPWFKRIAYFRQSAFPIFQQQWNRWNKHMIKRLWLCENSCSRTIGGLSKTSNIFKIQTEWINSNDNQKWMHICVCVNRENGSYRYQITSTKRWFKDNSKMILWCKEWNAPFPWRVFEWEQKVKKKKKCNEKWGRWRCFKASMNLNIHM